MTINVTNCKDCIFRQSDFDPDSMGKDTLDSCILLRELSNNTLNYKDYHIVSYDSFNENGEEYFPECLNTTLPNCPLKEQEIIVKLNV